MKAMPEHSPLPWKSADGRRYSVISDADRKTVYATPANAAYIVTAANAFPELVAALQEIDDLVLDECDRAPSIARDALKTAGVTE